MLFYHIVILALIQGLTEFLPVSSSGHLILAHNLMGRETVELWQENLMMDVAVHVGTLLSVLLYFRKDVWSMICGLFCLVCRKNQGQGASVTGAGASLVGFILVSSLPVIVAGFALHHFQPDILRTLEVMAWSTLIFGIVLWVVDARSPATRAVKDLTWHDALWIGLAQALALIPGTSRSGITMTAARYLGFTRREAAHYSLLLSIVAISGAGLLGALDVLESGSAALTGDVLIAVLLSFASGLLAINLMMKWLEQATFKPFAIYRIIMGVLLLSLIYSDILLKSL